MGEGVSEQVGQYISAFLVASAGTLWFAYVLKGLQKMSPTNRFAAYGGIWLAYFVLTIILIRQTGA